VKISVKLPIIYGNRLMWKQKNKKQNVLNFFMPFCFVLFPGIYLKRNIPVKTGKELNPIIEKI
jgi:hypothetical protein